jgi:ABC-2 type transport system permease protein
MFLLASLPSLFFAAENDAPGTDMIQAGLTQMTSAEASASLAIIFSFLLYIFIFTYGSLVMRSIVSEKSNKILEVMFLSVKPLEMMYGKIISVALVGITQFAAWAVILFLLNSISSTDNISFITSITSNAEWGSLLPCIIIYSLLGYLLYASLFAAIGAVSGPETDTQQFLLPVMLPIVFAIYSSIQTAYYPDNDIAMWCSFIPLTSPIVMTSRLCYGVESWEVLLSMLILTVTVILTTYLSGKIYKSAILLHGKRLTYKDISDFLKI